MSAAPRFVVLVAFPGVQILNIAGPMEMLRGAWSAVRERRPGAFSEPPYATCVVAATADPIASSAGLRIVADRRFGDELPAIDTLMVVGGEIENALSDESLMAFVRRSAPRARRIVALGAGTFILARAGLLDGRRATTHWRHCEPLAKEYPKVV